MKRFFLVTFLTLLTIFKESWCMTQENLLRWSQLMLVAAHIEQDAQKHNELLQKSYTFALTSQDVSNKNHKPSQHATAKKLIKKINKSENFTSKAYSADARKAYYNKIIAHLNFKEAQNKNLLLKSIQRQLEKTSHKKKQEELQTKKTLTVKEKNAALDRAHHFYCVAADHYLNAFDCSHKERHLNYARTIILERLYDVETERFATSNIYIILDEKTRIYNEIKNREGIL